MQKKIFTQITHHQQITTKNIDHTTVNFVVDSTNIICTKNPNEIQEYINKFYILLEAVYNANKLIINKDKTELMIICKKRHRQLTKNIQMIASCYKVKQVSHVKILGYIIQNTLCSDRQINKTIANINKRLYNIKKLGNKKIKI